MSHDLTIYHNPRCSKSRQTLAIIEASGIEPKIVRYLESPPDATTLKTLLKKLEMAPRDLLRKGEEAYKTLKLADKSLSDETIIDAMADNPKLIERPIVVKGGLAVLGRPPENVKRLLSS